MSTVSPARRAAFDILMEMERGRAHSDDLLRGSRLGTLSTADRGLAAALVLGVLRWQILLDKQIRKFLDRPGTRLDSEIRIALRLGSFQLLHLSRVPAHAAIDESVELAKKAGHRFASRMVNAVLRKLAIGAREIDPVAGNDAIAAHPAWLVERWTKAYGPDAARAICEHGQQQAPSVIRLRGADDEAKLVNAGIEVQPAQLLTAARTAIAGDVAAAAAFQTGNVRFQDEGSQLVGELAASYGSGADTRILDTCAAPGGKTMILAERNPAARIVACESSASRIAALKERIAIFGARVDCRHVDASALTDENAYDAVLADVPCSGTGTLGRNPEIRHRLKAEDLSRQSQRQRAILTAALRAVKPGGTVVYSTCSLEPEENEDVVEAVISAVSSVSVRPMRERLELLRRGQIVTGWGAEALQACVTDQGFLRLLPGVAGTDAFFVALLAKQ
jgi:16S rRNA (cytosine967-C5)-methyltransferase